MSLGDIYRSPRYRLFADIEQVAQFGRYDIVRYYDHLWAVWGGDNGHVVTAHPKQPFSWEKVPEEDRQMLATALELLK